jgi:hypothetical protein
MKHKITLIGAVFFMVILLIWANVLQQSVSAHSAATPTSVWPPPTRPPDYYQQLLRQKWPAFSESLQSLQVDLTCPIPCWADFTPGMPIRELVNIIGQGRPISLDDSAPNNVIGIDGHSLTVAAFSDSTKPEPLLRAYYIGIYVDLFGVTPAEIRSALPQVVVDLLPDAQLTSVETSLAVLTGSIEGEGKRHVYSIIYEYSNWAIQYFYRSPSVIQTCPEDRLLSINIWVYSQMEQNFQTLWADIQQKYQMPAINQLQSTDKLPSLRFQTLDTQAFKATRQAGQCTPLDSQ